MSKHLQTPLYDRHLALGAKMVEFGGWDMPLLYPTGIVAEHLATRKRAGLFDVSHMGRFLVGGAGAVPFLQHLLSSNVEALEVGQAQYSLLPTETGGAVDDAYLYRFRPEEFLLVVNAANRTGDWEHLHAHRSQFPDVELVDRTGELAMLALQGPESRARLTEVLEAGELPAPQRNALSEGRLAGAPVWLARTGYTGEPLCFELFLPAEAAGKAWDLLVHRGAAPVGLGARDTLRLEAGLPLYGHELGTDAAGREVPIFACASARPAVSFSPRKGAYLGREALARQHEAYRRMLLGDFSQLGDLPRVVRPLAVLGPGVARAGAAVYRGQKEVGAVTSGTMVPYWRFEGGGLHARPGEEQAQRALCLAYVDSRVANGDRLTLDVPRRGRYQALAVLYHLRSEAPPYARPIVYDSHAPCPTCLETAYPARAQRLLEAARDNTLWRQRECVNLIPSEMTTSPMVRLLSVMDPAFRYAEHRAVKAFDGAEVFYYQGIDFIAEVEQLLALELGKFLGCAAVELRPLSGQMANAVVFGGLLDYLNRGERGREPRRLARVLNHSLVKGGHLSAQPMGALHDYVARDPRTERPAVVNFPTRPDIPYLVDVPATRELIAATRPELIIFGRSMVLHKEPLAEIRRFLDEQELPCVVMYDMAHVLGLVGPHFQQPFAEGADLVTGSTHKTFFGTQRGLIGGDRSPGEPRYPLWEAIQRRAFPGATSNHHLGTLLGLLLAAYEMNAFKEEYQPAVLANAKAFARALKEAGLQVEGDPAAGYTETHQVIVRVGHGRGPEMAALLEANNLICNYQATPDEEGFTAAGALRMGVAEMTRFGMGPEDFRELAGLIADVVLRGANAREAVRAFRARFQELHYCFAEEDFAPLMEQLRELV